MPLTKYIKQPMSPSLSQYVDAELRKIETSVFNLVETSDTLILAVEALAAEVAALDHWTATIKSADTSKASDVTLAADPHLSVPIASTGIWLMECVVDMFCASANPDIKFNFAYSGLLIPTPPSAGNFVQGVPNATNIYDSLATGSSVTTIALLAAAERTTSFIGILNASSIGDLKFQWAQATTDASPTIVRAGSFIRVRKLI